LVDNESQSLSSASSLHAQIAALDDLINELGGPGAAQRHRGPSQAEVWQDTMLQRVLDREKKERQQRRIESKEDAEREAERREEDMKWERERLRLIEAKRRERRNMGLHEGKEDKYDPQRPEPASDPELSELDSDSGDTSGSGTDLQALDAGAALAAQRAQALREIYAHMHDPPALQRANAASVASLAAAIGYGPPAAGRGRGRGELVYAPAWHGHGYAPVAPPAGRGRGRGGVLVSGDQSPPSSNAPALQMAPPPPAALGSNGGNSQVPAAVFHEEEDDEEDEGEEDTEEEEEEERLMQEELDDEFNRGSS
jgi:hypothetical protein